MTDESINAVSVSRPATGPVGSRASVEKSGGRDGGVLKQIDRAGPELGTLHRGPDSLDWGPNAPGLGGGSGEGPLKTRVEAGGVGVAPARRSISTPTRARRPTERRYVLGCGRSGCHLFSRPR